MLCQYVQRTLMDGGCFLSMNYKLLHGMNFFVASFFFPGIGCGDGAQPEEIHRWDQIICLNNLSGPVNGFNLIKTGIQLSTTFWWVSLERQKMENGNGRMFGRICMEEASDAFACFRHPFSCGCNLYGNWNRTRAVEKLHYTRLRELVDAFKIKQWVMIFRKIEVDQKYWALSKCYEKFLKYSEG